MKTYKKNTTWPLIAAVLFSAASVINFLNKSYTGAILMIILASLWLASYYLNQRPYLSLGEGKMILGRGLYKPKEFLLSDLQIIKIDKGSVTFLHQGKEQFSILLTVMNKNTMAEFLDDLQKSIKKTGK